ncbi:alpha/beta fold hydrolase [Rathayibacter sp. YIM 133350]|uniref:dienelactone hydrolase family protein n=1 Tax=Rathayibacter sp. YIM 133350 TaxID=3131992 RepID=UPI00307DD3AF
MTTPAESRRIVNELLALGALEAYRPRRVQRDPLRSQGGIGWDRVEIVSGDGDTIPCLLLLPSDATGPCVIAIHQHAGDFSLGKSEVAGIRGDPSMAYGLRLAQHGVVALIPDLVGFEERQRRWSARPTDDEQRDALHRVAPGDSLQSKHTRDIATLTTWLLAEIAGAAGVSVMGHSLGGQVALFNLAADSRLRAGVVSCGAGTLASFAEHHIAHNPAWFVPGLAAAGDTPLLARAIERPMFLSAGLHDPLFPLAGVEAVVGAFAPGLCAVDIFDGGHELPSRVASSAIRFLMGAGDPSRKARSL